MGLKKGRALVLLRGELSEIKIGGLIERIFHSYVAWSLDGQGTGWYAQDTVMVYGFGIDSSATHGAGSPIGKTHFTFSVLPLPFESLSGLSYLQETGTWVSSG